MTREIKFRAWCKHSPMRQVFGLDEYSLYFDEGLPENGFYGLEPTTTRDAKSAWVLMQYTGLKDKNGVEIYEGDIDVSGLEVTYCGDTEGSLGMNCGWYLQTGDFNSWFELECDNTLNIVGNIYEGVKDD
jgi:hypothetical protein